MFKHTLPQKPVDKYQIEWWSLRISSAWCYIEHCVAIYHVNTPWDEYKPDCKGGADLVDDWMICAGGSASGRVHGWRALFAPSFDWENGFATEKEAAEEAIKRLNGYITQYKGEIAEVESIKKEVVDKHLSIAQNA